MPYLCYHLTTSGLPGYGETPEEAQSRARYHYTIETVTRKTEAASQHLVDLGRRLAQGEDPARLYLVSDRKNYRGVVSASSFDEAVAAAWEILRPAKKTRTKTRPRYRIDHVATGHTRVVLPYTPRPTNQSRYW